MNIADIQLDNCPININKRFSTRAFLYVRFITKYKLLKDFLPPCLIHSLIINRSGWLINVRTILTLF